MLLRARGVRSHRQQQHHFLSAYSSGMYPIWVQGQYKLKVIDWLKLAKTKKTSEIIHHGEWSGHEFGVFLQTFPWEWGCYRLEGCCSLLAQIWADGVCIFLFIFVHRAHWFCSAQNVYAFCIFLYGIFTCIHMHEWNFSLERQNFPRIGRIYGSVQRDSISCKNHAKSIAEKKPGVFPLAKVKENSQISVSSALRTTSR